MESVEFTRLRAGSIFKIGYLAMLGVVLPLTIIAGLMALGGADTVSLNERNVHGVGGLITAVVLGLILPAIFAGIMVLGSFVVRAFSRFILRRGRSTK